MWLREKRQQWVHRLSLWGATYQASKQLDGNAPIRVLIDNSVLAHGRIFSSYWFDTGPKKWGAFTAGAGYADPGLTYSPESDPRVFEQTRFLPAISHLAKQGRLELLTSFELRNEQVFQPAGRFSMYGYYDHNLFEGLTLRCIDCKEVESYDWQEKPQDRLRSSEDQPFRGIVDLIGEKNNVDAWHIHTAEIHGVDYFLHIDFSLDEEMRKNRKKNPIATLRTRVVLPSTFAAKLGIGALDLELVQPGV